MKQLSKKEETLILAHNRLKCRPAPCTGCGRDVVYDEESKLYHCGGCVRVGERVEACGQLAAAWPNRRLVGRVLGFDSGDNGWDRVRVEWDHLPGSDDSVARGGVKHLNALDRLAAV